MLKIMHTFVSSNRVSLVQFNDCRSARSSPVSWKLLHKPPGRDIPHVDGCLHAISPNSSQCIRRNWMQGAHTYHRTREMLWENDHRRPSATPGSSCHSAM